MECPTDLLKYTKDLLIWSTIGLTRSAYLRVYFVQLHMKNGRTGATVLFSAGVVSRSNNLDFVNYT
jgi:hypothetical protein